jgi:hypothetical protein
VTGLARRLIITLAIPLLLLGGLEASGLLRRAAPLQPDELPSSPEVSLPEVAANSGAPEPLGMPQDHGASSRVLAGTPALDQPRRIPPRPFRPDLSRLLEIDAAIKKYARAHGVEEDLVWAVIRQESGFNPTAVSPKGALGLMQLMPGTAVMMGVLDPFDVEQNIGGGIKYLENCLNRFQGDVELALAAYNAGPENVIKYQGCPPFPETQHYVETVMRNYSAAAAPRIGGLRREKADVPGPGGLVWNLPAPVVKVPRPQWHVPSPRWQVITLSPRLKAMTARATIPRAIP